MPFCFDIMETIQTDVCYNNRQGYGMRGAAARPSCAGVSQDSVGVGIESTCLHGMNVVSCEIMWKVSEVDPG